MEISVREIINWFHSNYKDELVQIHIVKGENIDACFRRVYALRRSARYDSARRYDLESEELENLFRQWEEKNETIEMYYGSAVVD